MSSQKLAKLLLGAILATVLGGCAARASVGGRGCRYGWVDGHYNAYGRWIPGHCR